MTSRAVERARIEAGDTVVVLGPEVEAVLTEVLALVGEEGSVIVVDPSAEHLESVLTQSGDPRASFLIGDGSVLPLPDGSADVVLATVGVDASEVERVTRGRQ